MAKRPPGLGFDVIENDWILHKTTPEGKTSGIRLTAEEALRVIESAPFLRDRIMQRLQGGTATIQPIFVVPVEGIELGEDALGEHLLMKVTTASGPHATYSLTESQANTLAAKIPERLAAMRSSALTKQ